MKQRNKLQTRYYIARVNYTSKDNRNSIAKFIIRYYQNSIDPLENKKKNKINK